MSRRAILAAAVLGLAGYVFVYATGRANPPIRSDGYSYYVYLPAWFIHGDAGLSAVARDCCGGEFPAFTAIIRWPGTNQWVNAHPIGVAVLQTPFFLIGHGLTKWSNISPDGFTLYYQHAAGLSGLAWAIAGLYMLRRLLRRNFADGVTTATLVTLFFGTGLYHYATYDSSYSHVYSFFLFTTFLYLTELWWADSHRSPNWTRAMLVGVVAGLIVLTRHTNALFLLIFPLYGVRNAASLRAAVSSLTARWRELALLAATGALVILPQLLLYFRATGRFLVSSYGDLGFNFTSPHLWGVLFSVQKGLFFWSPLLLLALVGWMLGHKATRPLVVGAIVVMALDIYLIASWWDWQFGASYGHRGFIDTLPLFALGLAALFEWSTMRPQRMMIVGTIASMAVFLSVFQMLQYWNGVLPMSDMTWDQYRGVFLRLR
jgi:hypothetical protein